MVELLVSLTDSSVPATAVSPSRVGGKASSLARLYGTEGLVSHVPVSLALTVDFFSGWIEELSSSKDFAKLKAILDESDETLSKESQKQATKLCDKLKTASASLPTSKSQSKALSKIAKALVDTPTKLAAVRSSAPEEDGAGASFAGAFDTKLGVECTPEALLEAVRECFASLWDYRVMLYKKQQKNVLNAATDDSMGFCVVIMEMVDSAIAGVAFSANPLNSDRDELVIDASWGLGESVVDGSVTADRFTVNKITNQVVEESLGTKGVEKRLGTKGGVVETTIEESDPKYSSSSLTKEQIVEITKLVCLVEETYGMPMDCEWAFCEDGTSKLLQARPITTLYSVDPEMMTKPGEKRKLYWDFNIASEATTTTPFTTLDNDFYIKCCIALCGITFAEAKKKDFKIMSEIDPDQLMYAGRTRQYFNLGFVFKYTNCEKLADGTEFVDPYVSSLFKSKDLDKESYEGYKTKHWRPDGWTLRAAIKFFKTFPVMELYKRSVKYSKDPKGSVDLYREIVKADMEKMEQVAAVRNENSTIEQLSGDLCDAMSSSLLEEIGSLMGSGLKIIKDLDEVRRNGATEQIREDAEALCMGFDGDELMEMNIAMYRLAQLLPSKFWDEYETLESMKDLAKRIQAEKKGDLPPAFLNAWKEFIAEYGWDGQDQMFISSPRYTDSPELLLQKLKFNAKNGIKDPSITAKEQLEKRLAVEARQEEEAKKEAASESKFRSFLPKSKKKKLAKLQKRNAVLDNVLWMRNAPKLHLSRVIGKIREIVLETEEDLIARGILEAPGDIFHLTTEEIDRAKSDKEMDVMAIVRPRRAHYAKALEVSKTTCPVLVDSRCRILRPDPPPKSDDPNVLVGAAISPGVATGKVRIVHSPTENDFQSGEVLCALVTGPAWTPLFASASAVVLRIGGVLQHGALCAREYGKPAVSNIDVMGLLKDGMTVSVDGTTGIVTILETEDGDNDKEEQPEALKEEKKEKKKPKSKKKLDNGEKPKSKKKIENGEKPKSKKKLENGDSNKDMDESQEKPKSKKKSKESKSKKDLKSKDSKSKKDLSDKDKKKKKKTKKEKEPETSTVENSDSLSESVEC